MGALYRRTTVVHYGTGCTPIPFAGIHLDDLNLVGYRYEMAVSVAQPCSIMTNLRCTLRRYDGRQEHDWFLAHPMTDYACVYHSPLDEVGRVVLIVRWSNFDYRDPVHGICVTRCHPTFLISQFRNFMIRELERRMFWSRQIFDSLDACILWPSIQFRRFRCVQTVVINNIKTMRADRCHPQFHESGARTATV